MGALLRCTSCGKDMVIEAYHAGRDVPCPWCRARNDVPPTLDFRTVDTAQARDEARGGTMLMLAMAGALCPPSAGFVWWWAHTTLSRAEDEGRPGDGLVRAARLISAVFAILYSAVLVVLLANWLS
jgi:hypothetical protein